MPFYKPLLAAEFIIAVPIFIMLFFISAPYGKFIKSGWGPAVRAPLAWFFMELPAVVLPAGFFIFSGQPQSMLCMLFIIIWEVHYIQRTFIYPALMNRGSHKMPILIILFSAVFNLLNGFVNGFGIFSLHNYGTPAIISLRFISGAAIFTGGFFINMRSDHILRNLRVPGESGYKIPEQGLFRYVCSPHYLGELLEWTGWAVMTWSPAGAAFMCFTAANLIPRAYSNLKWYRQTFPGYPEKRKAIIPFIL